MNKPMGTGYITSLADLADMPDLDDFLAAPATVYHPAQEQTQDGFLKNFAKGAINHLPIYGSLRKNEKALDAALKVADSYTNGGIITGTDLHEAMYRSGVNNTRTKKALRQALAEKGTFVFGDVKSAYENENVGGVLGGIQKAVNYTLDKTGLDNHIGKLEIYKGKDAWDTFKRNTNISGEVGALVSGLALAGIGASATYALSSVAGGVDEAQGSHTASGLYGAALGTMGLMTAIAGGNFMSAARSGAMIGAQVAGKAAKGNSDSAAAKLAHVLGLGLTAGSLGIAYKGLSYADFTGIYDAIDNAAGKVADAGLKGVDTILSAGATTAKAQEVGNVEIENINPNETGPKQVQKVGGWRSNEPITITYEDAKPRINFNTILTPNITNIFGDVALRSQGHELWGLLAEADSNNDGLVTLDEAGAFLEGRSDAEQIKLKYGSLFDFDKDGNGIDMFEASDFLGDLRTKYVSPFQAIAEENPKTNIWNALSLADAKSANQNGVVTLKEFSGINSMNDTMRYGNDLFLGHDTTHDGVDVFETSDYLEDKLKANLHNFKNSQRITHPLVGDGLYIEGTEGNLNFQIDIDFDNPHDKKLIALENKIGHDINNDDLVVRIFQKGKGTPIAVADIGADGESTAIIGPDGNIITNDTFIHDGLMSGKYVAEATFLDENDTVSGVKCGANYDDDDVHIFARWGDWKEHAPKHPHKPHLMPKTQVDHTHVSDKIMVTTDRGWEGFEGRHTASQLKGKTIVLNSGDHIGVGPTEEAVADNYDTQTAVLHNDGSDVYGRKTIPSKLKNIFLPKEKEWDRYKISETQDGSKGDPIVLDGNNGIFGNDSEHPDEVKFKYRKYETTGGHKIFGKSHTMLGGVNVDDTDNGRNDYTLKTKIAHENKDNIVGKHEQKVHVNPIRNSTVAAGTALGTLGLTQLVNSASAAGKGTEVVFDAGIKGGQVGNPGITGGQ